MIIMAIGTIYNNIHYNSVYKHYLVTLVILYNDII
jgi:hypothetical protein